jgi:hypothetical protein
MTEDFLSRHNEARKIDLIHAIKADLQLTWDYFEQRQTLKPDGNERERKAYAKNEYEMNRQRQSLLDYFGQYGDLVGGEEAGRKIVNELIEDLLKDEEDKDPKIVQFKQQLPEKIWKDEEVQIK